MNHRLFEIIIILVRSKSKRPNSTSEIAIIHQIMISYEYSPKMFQMYQWILQISANL